jgi:hypothetical protein
MMREMMRDVRARMPPQRQSSASDQGAIVKSSADIAWEQKHVRFVWPNGGNSDTLHYECVGKAVAAVRAHFDRHNRWQTGISDGKTPA